MWDVDGKTAAHLTQYKQFIDSIAAKAKDFGKPVLLFNGDSHFYRADNPLVQGTPCVIEPSPGAAAVTCAAGVMPVGNPPDPYTNQPNGYNVPNFHRVVVHGSALPLEWLKLTVDPHYDRMPQRRRASVRSRSTRWCADAGRSGGRYWDRTSGPSRVRGVLYR